MLTMSLGLQKIEIIKNGQLKYSEAKIQFMPKLRLKNVNKLLIHG